MPRSEIQSILSLALIMSFRMLGLFMIFPVFSVYAKQLPDATPTLIGIALGSYGLTQALLQIPFGSLSDRWGRKPLITIGLLIFAAGSVIAALSDSIYGIILGRTLQGAGAVGSTLLALLADLTRDENRTPAMATMGLIIGCSFAVAMIVGPWLNAAIHISGIFWVTAALALLGIVLLYTLTPKAPKPFSSRTKASLIQVFKDPKLLPFNYGIFALHAILTASFVALPLNLACLEVTRSQQTWLYSLTLVLAFISMLPFIIVAEKKRHFKPVFVGAIAVLLLTQLLFLILPSTLLHITIVLFLFFTSFTLLEASLPSLISKAAPLHQKGTAMGLYSSSQFFGIFVGGVMGGWIFSHANNLGLYSFTLLLTLIWLILAFKMEPPQYCSTWIMKLTDKGLARAELEALEKIPGVSEIAYSPEEHLLLVKADSKIITQYELRKLIGAGNLAPSS